MEHVKHVTSTKMGTLKDVKFGNSSLFNTVDNAGQTLWISMMPTYKGTLDKFAEFAGSAGMELSDAQAAAAGKMFYDLSARLISSRVNPPVKFPAETVHQFLSLEHHLQPQTDDGAREGIELALKHLNLPAVTPPDQLKQKLPAMMASIQATVAEQNKMGGWIG